MPISTEDCLIGTGEDYMSINKKKVKNFIGISAVALGAAFVGMSIAAKKKKAGSVYDNEPEQKNPMVGKKVVFVEDENDKENADGVKGHLEACLLYTSER